MTNYQVDQEARHNERLRLAEEARMHDERIRLGIFSALRRQTNNPSSVDWYLKRAADVYAEITGREWQRTPQDRA